MQNTARSVALFALLALGCTGPSGLSVQLVSNLTPRRDVDAVTISVSGVGGYTHDEHVTLDAGQSLGRPRRVLALEGLAAGAYTIDLQLEHDGARVVGRTLRVVVSGETIRTVQLTRDCSSVTCGASETCVDGRCVSPECSEETPEACGMPLCHGDGDCLASGVACAPTRCTASGACQALPDDTQCTAPAPVCDATLGCLGVLDTPLVLTGSTTLATRSLAIHGQTADATEVWAGVSPTRLPSPTLDAIRALGQCSQVGAAITCVRESLAPSTTYYAYAVAVRVSASGDQTSNVYEEAVTTLGETTLMSFTSGGAPAQAVVWAPDAARLGTTATFPTIVFLHGGGEMNNPDPLSILTGDGLLRSLLADRAMASTFPFIVVAPHCSNAVRSCNGWPAEITMPIDALDAAAAMFPVDAHRVYATGLSFGGEGVYRFAALHPDRVAAVAPLSCTTWSPTPPMCAMSAIPVWNFHGAHDTFWAPSASQSYLDALAACPAPSAPRQLTLIDCMTPGDSLNHCSWDQVYSDMLGGASFEGQTSVFDWFLTHTSP